MASPNPSVERSFQITQQKSEKNKVTSTVQYNGRTYTVIHSKSVKLDKIEKQMLTMMGILNSCKEVQAVRYENVHEEKTLGVKLLDETSFRKLSDLASNENFQSLVQKINDVFSRHIPKNLEQIPADSKPIITKESIEQEIKTLAEQMKALGETTPGTAPWNDALQNMEKGILEVEKNWTSYCKQIGIESEKIRRPSGLTVNKNPPELEFVKGIKELCRLLQNPRVTSDTHDTYKHVQNCLEKCKEATRMILQPLYANLEKAAGKVLDKKLPDSELKQRFHQLMEAAFSGKGCIDIDQLKAFVLGCNFPTVNHAGAVRIDDVFRILESFLGPLDSDVAQRIYPPDGAPEGYTAVGAGLSVSRALGGDGHAYSLVRTPDGGKHAFSHGQDTKYWEGTLGSEKVDEESVNEAFAGNAERIYNSPGFNRDNDRSVPTVDCVVYVKNEYAQEMTQVLGLFHDLPWFGGKCQALAALTLVMIMQRTKQLAHQ